MGNLGSSAYPARVIVHPSVTGDVWVSTEKGLFHTTDSGATFKTISSVSQAWSIALGAPKTTGGYPALYANANVDSVIGYFRSDDAGVNWVQINDATHGFGAAGSVIGADSRTYGRIYVGTNGRGIFVGDASGTAPSPTATATATATSTSKTSSTASSTVSTSTSKTSSTVSSTTKTSSTVSSTTKTSTAPTSTATGTVQKYGQCGGTCVPVSSTVGGIFMLIAMDLCSGYTGPTTCVTGTTCTYSNDCESTRSSKALMLAKSIFSQITRSACETAVDQGYVFLRAGFRRRNHKLSVPGPCASIALVSSHFVFRLRNKEAFHSKKA